jgi:hypothetical protein
MAVEKVVLLLGMPVPSVLRANEPWVPKLANPRRIAIN